MNETLPPLTPEEEKQRAFVMPKRLKFGDLRVRPAMADTIVFLRDIKSPLFDAKGPADDLLFIDVVTVLWMQTVPVEDVADVIYSRDPGLLRREVAKFLSTIAREDFGKVTTFVFDLLANGGVGSDYAVKKGDEGPK